MATKEQLVELLDDAIFTLGTRLSGPDFTLDVEKAAAAIASLVWARRDLERPLESITP